MEIKKWLINHIAEESGDPVETIDCDVPFEDYNMDSLAVVSLSFDLENLLDKSIDPTIFTEYNTINKLVEWLETQK